VPEQALSAFTGKLLKYLYLSIASHILDNRDFLSILGGMRLILTMASLLIVSLVIFNGYANDQGIDGNHIDGQILGPITRAGDINTLIQDAASIQRQVLAEQIQK
jgi:hypothetical protein